MNEDSIEELVPSQFSNESTSNNYQNYQLVPLISGQNSINSYSLLEFNSSFKSQQTSKGKDIDSLLKYLNEFKDAEKLLENELAISALVDINEIYRKNREKISVMIELKFQLVLRELFYYIYENFSNYVESETYDIDLENTDSKFTTFHLLVDIVEILVVTSKEFASIFHMVGGVKCYLNFFDNQKLIGYMIKSCSDSDMFKSARRMNYCKALASMLNTLLYLKTNRHQSFKEFNVVQVLSKFANSLNFQNCELILRSHFVLGNLCTKKELENLTNLEFTVLILEKTIQMFAQACQKKTKYNSYQFDLFYENDMRSFEINTHGSPNTFILIMLSVIEAFMVNDEIKYRFLGTIKNSLLIFLLQGDLIEKYLALSLFTDLAFDDVLNEKIRQNSNILVILDQILTQTNQLEETIRPLALCLKYLLNIKKLVIDYENKTIGKNILLNNTNSSINPKSMISLEKKILLSYHDTSELICMRLRNELEYNGFSSELIERKSMNNFDIVNIIKSIENCECLIICLSSAYEYEKICQFETILAKKLGKCLIPVLVQSKYTPDYWLENILDDTKPILISLASIKNDVYSLVKEISNKTGLKPKQKKQTMQQKSSTSSIKSSTCEIL